MKEQNFGRNSLLHFFLNSTDKANLENERQNLDFESMKLTCCFYVVLYGSVKRKKFLFDEKSPKISVIGTKISLEV